MLRIRVPGADWPQGLGIRPRTRRNVLLLALFAFLLASLHAGVLCAQVTGEITALNHSFAMNVPLCSECAQAASCPVLDQTSLAGYGKAMR